MILMLLPGCQTKETGQAGGSANENTEAKVAKKILKYNMAEDPRTLDPQLNSSIKAGDIINNIYEGLMREVDGKYVPGIAESYEVSDDGLIYTFHLRDAKWSDGQPITAHDFVYSWKRAADPTTASDYANLMYYIAGGYEFFNGEGSYEDVKVKALDDKTLEVTLTAPTPFFLELTAFYTFMPVRQDVVEKDPEGWAKNPELIVTNGPFQLAEYKMGDRAVLAKNENYWNADNVKLDEIVCYTIVEESTSLTVYESGELDIITNIPLQEIPQIMANNPEFHITQRNGTSFYVFNVKKPPLDDVRVRKALTLAIDRKSIVDNVTKGGETPAVGFVPPVAGMKDTRGNIFREMAPDYGIAVDSSKVDEAKRLLAEAGYPDGKGFPEIDISYNTSEANKAIVEGIQEMWKKNLNIHATLTNQEWSVFANNRRNGNFYVARHNWIGDYADPVTFLDLYNSDGGNTASQWVSKEYNELMNKIKTENDPIKRDEALYAAEKMLFDEQLFMPIFHHTDKMLVKDYVKDWKKTTALGNWYFGTTDIVK